MILNKHNASFWEIDADKVNMLPDLKFPVMVKTINDGFVGIVEGVYTDCRSFFQAEILANVPYGLDEWQYVHYDDRRKRGSFRQCKVLVILPSGEKLPEQFGAVEFLPPFEQDAPAKVEDVIGPDMLPIAKLAPKNPTVRAYILAKIRKEVPASIETFEDLSKWISENHKVTRELYAPNIERLRSIDPVKTGTLEIPMTYYDQVSGRCRYTAERSGSRTLTFDQEEIRGIIEAIMESDDTLEESIGTIREHIQEKVWDNRPPMEEDEDSYHYHDYESDDTDESRFEIGSTTRLLAELAKWCRLNLTQEQCEELRVHNVDRNE